MKIHKIIVLFKYIASVIFSNSLTKINFLFFLDKRYKIDPIGNGHIPTICNKHYQSTTQKAINYRS